MVFIDYRHVLIFLVPITCLSQSIARFSTIDIINNNAGDDTCHATEDVTPAFWDRCIAVNLKHQFFATQAVIPGMKWQSRGVILNMSSVSWMIPSTGLPVYTASKAAGCPTSRF